MSNLSKKDAFVRFLGCFLLLFVFSASTLKTVPTGWLPESSAIRAQEEEDDAGAAEEAAPTPVAAGGDAPPPAEQKSYLFWYLEALGPLFAPTFAVLSVVFVTLIVMNWMSINRNFIMPQAMIDRFKQLIEEGDYQAAYEEAKASESPQGKILAAGLAKMSAGFEAAEQTMSDVAEEEIMKLEQRLGYIGTIGGIAPMVGLLGTVFGMVASFQVIATAGTAPQASELAGGISTALITTQIGLIIAIPAILIYEFFRNKLSLLVLEMTVLTENLMSRFKTSE